jgi:hypothetical protein
MTRADERQAAAMEEVYKAFELVCPHIVGNPFIPHWPLPQQANFLGAHVGIGEETFEALYGGACGGGKSDALLMGAAQYAWKHGDFAGVCIRRTYADLDQPDALMDRARKWWIPAGAHWNGSSKMFTFPSGAQVKMNYHSHPTHNMQFQGAAYQYVAWDELTHWPDTRAYDYVSYSRTRRSKTSGVPIRILSASNPGGPGHNWVKRKFIGGVDPETGRDMPAEAPFFPALLKDNKHLDQEQYVKSLERMDVTLKMQLLHGDWSARRRTVGATRTAAECAGGTLPPQSAQKRVGRQAC